MREFEKLLNDKISSVLEQNPHFYDKGGKPAAIFSAGRQDDDKNGHRIRINITPIHAQIRDSSVAIRISGGKLNDPPEVREARRVIAENFMLQKGFHKFGLSLSSEQILQKLEYELEQASFPVEKKEGQKPTHIFGTYTELPNINMPSGRVVVYIRPREEIELFRTHYVLGPVSIILIPLTKDPLELQKHSDAVKEWLTERGYAEYQKDNAPNTGERIIPKSWIKLYDMEAKVLKGEVILVKLVKETRSKRMPQVGFTIKSAKEGPKEILGMLREYLPEVLANSKIDLTIKLLK